MKSFKTTAVATTALCALLGACTSVGKPLYPIDDHAAAPPVAPPPPPPVAAPPAPVAQEDAAPLAKPTQRIDSTTLGPPPGAREAPPPEARPAETRPAATYAYPAARASRAPTQLAQAAAPPPAPAAPAMVMQKAPGSGPVKTETPEPVKVKKGDTLIAISHRTGIFVADLADENDLKKPYRLKPGSSIKLPSKRYYLVQNGDTLYSIARRFGLEAKALAEFNKFEVGASVRGGQKLYLPADAKDKGVPKPIMVAAPAPKTSYARPSPAEEAQAPPVREAAPPVVVPDIEAPPRRAEQVPTPPPSAPPVAQAVPVAPRAPATPQRAAAPPPGPVVAAPVSRPPAAADAVQSSADVDVAAAGRGVFQWPVRGEMIAPFGPKGATRNDGIDLGATKGDSVRSAAAGEVVYAGNAVQGFGNLVLIKHDGGWVTAYAHLANIEVKMRQQVAQGQEIGLVGETGGVDRPQLHFEIRYAPTPKDKARPIDPMLVLPVQ